MLRLILPSTKYKNGFYNYLQELQKEGRINASVIKEVKSQRFSEYIKKLREQSKGLHLPKNFVSSTEYWLIDKNTFIGTLRLRHKLNKKLREIGGAYRIHNQTFRKMQGVRQRNIAKRVIKSKKIRF